MVIPKRSRRFWIGLSALVVIAMVLAGLYVARRMEIQRQVDRLTPGLSRSDIRDRAEAAQALTRLRGQWGDSPVEARKDSILAALMEGLEALEVDVRAGSAEALAAWGRQATDRLRKALTSPDDPTRISAAYALSRGPLPDLLPELRNALRDHRVEVRIYALEALAAMPLNQVDDELLSDVVFRVWKDSQAMARNAASEAVYRLGHWTGIPCLVRNLEGKFWPRFNAYERLVRIYGERGLTLPPYYADGHTERRDREAARVREVVFSDPELQRRLIADLGHNKNLVYTNTKWSVSELGHHIVPALTRALNDPDKHVRTGAAEMLFLLGDRQTPAALRDDAAEALRTIARPALATRLADSRNDVDVDVALYALKALANYGTAEEIPTLLACVRRPDPDLAVAAITAIGGIGGKTALQALTDLKVSGELEDERQRALARIQDSQIQNSKVQDR